MKRSEMLIHLDDELCAAWGFDMKLQSAQLDTILAILERAGMLPPRTVTKPQTREQALAEGFSPRQLHKWTPE